MKKRRNLLLRIFVTLLVLVLLSPVNMAQAAEGPAVAEEAALSAPRQPETLSAGYKHSCAIQSDGTLVCWGWNDRGQSTPPAGTFNQVSAGSAHTCGLKSDGTLVCWGDDTYDQSSPPAGTFTQLSAGGQHTCGLKSDGTLVCWGDDTYGQATPPADTFTQISAGGGHSCGIKSDGTLACWGRNDYSQATPLTGTFTQVSTGHVHTCGLRSDGTLACWGWNGYGQTTSPTGTFTQLSAGIYHNCGLKSDGTLACWGDNTNGKATPPAGTFTQVSADYQHTCGLKSDGTLACWGLNDFGQSTPPASDFGLRRVRTGGYHTCGIKSDGALACWGLNDVGESTPPSGSFSQVSMGDFHACGLKNDGTLACWGYNHVGQATPPTGTFTQISTDYYHSCGLKSDGTLACWGQNNYGQSSPPVGIFSQVSAGHFHACGLKSDGSLACWGMNIHGQSTPPTGTFTQLSAGSLHNCGLKSDGTLACWGENSYGQSNPPAGTFTQISAGGQYTCGLKNDGTLVCWGDNSYSKATPPAGTFTQVSAGSSHTCGVRSDGIVLCWGDNSYNQAPAITLLPTSLPGGNKGIPYSQTLSGEGGTPPYSFGLLSGSLPPGLTLSSSGVLSGTPTTAGSYTYTVQIMDSTLLLGNSRSYTMLINTPPVADDQSVSTPEDEALAITLTAADVESDPLTWTIGTATHGTLTGTAPDLTYTPALNYHGLDSFTFYVHDGTINSNTATVTITVDPVNDISTAYNQSISTPEDTAVAITLTAIDVDGDPLDWSVGTATHGVLTGTAPALTYTPALNYYGTDSFTFQVSDGVLTSDLATVTLTVTPVNDAPALGTIGNQGTNELSLLTFTATATDSDIPSNTLSYFLDAGAPSGASISSDGIFTWTPTEAQGPGTYSVTARVTDNGDPALDDFETIQITVNEVNLAPVLATIGNQIGDELTLITFTASATDADLPTNTLTYSLDEGAPSGASISSDGILTWMPTEAQAPGTYSVTVRVSDNGNPALDDFETFEITVIEVNFAPVLATIGNQSGDELTLITFAASATDADLPTNTLTYSLDEGAPSGASISSDGIFTWTPTEAQGPGTYSVTVRVSDNGNPALDDFETFEITVNEVNVAPVLATIGNQSGDELTLITFAASATDADLPTNALTYSLDEGAPSGASISSDGIFTWTPTEAQGPGTYSVTVRVTDNGDPALDDFETFEITVIEVNLAPVAYDQPISTSEDTGAAITLIAMDMEGAELVWSVGTPEHGTLSGTAPELTYTPDLNYHGPDSFTFFVNDGSLNSNLATVTITVTAVNDAPQAADDGGVGFTTDENTAFTLADVLANDSDADGSSPQVANFNTGVTLGQVTWEDFPSGTLDPNFDGDGKLFTDFGGSDSGRAMVIQPDGKIVVAGTSNNNFALARYNPDGSLDPSFGSDGKQTTDLGGNDYAQDMALQADGKIVVAGYSYFSTPVNYDLSLARYNPDGSLDPSFDGDGKLTTHFSDYDFGYAVAIQADGKIIVAGYTYSTLHTDNDFFLARYLPNGSLDSSFDGDGLLTTDFDADDYGAALAIQSDGKIVVAGGAYLSGTSDYNFALARYNPDGSLDLSFDGDGKQTTNFSLDDSISDLAIQADGKIVAAGDANTNFALARYSPDGALDTSFDGDGKLTTDFGNADYGLALVLQPDGKIVAAGQSSNGSNMDFSLARYLPNGVLDPSFDGDGKLVTDFGNFDGVSAIALQSDIKIVAAGNSSGNFALARYTSGGGAFTYDPNGQFEYLNDGEIATDTFTYTISDGALSATATVIITIEGLNDAPTASTIADVDWLAREAHTYNIPAFSDVDGDTLTYSAKLAGGADIPLWLSINSLTGAFSGTPQNIDTGSYEIVVSANDGHGGNASTTFTLTVIINPFYVFLPSILR